MMHHKITEQGITALHNIVRQRFPHNTEKGKIDVGKLKDISEKPYKQLYGHVKYDTIYKKAACYLEGIVRHHPFPDGNKRTAMLATLSFLHRNGYYLVLPLDTVKFLVNVAMEEGSTEAEIDKLIDRIATWLEEHTATSKESHMEKVREIVLEPVEDLKKLDDADARRLLADWFALDFHPEYEEYVTEFIAFLMTAHAAMRKTLDDRQGSS